MRLHPHFGLVACLAVACLAVGTPAIAAPAPDIPATVNPGHSVTNNHLDLRLAVIAAATVYSARAPRAADPPDPRCFVMLCDPPTIPPLPDPAPLPLCDPLLPPDPACDPPPDPGRFAALQTFGAGHLTTFAASRPELPG